MNEDFFNHKNLDYLRHGMPKKEFLVIMNLFLKNYKKCKDYSVEEINNDFLKFLNKYMNTLIDRTLPPNIDYYATKHKQYKTADENLKAWQQGIRNGIQLREDPLVFNTDSFYLYGDKEHNKKFVPKRSDPYESMPNYGYDQGYYPFVPKVDKSEKDYLMAQFNTPFMRENRGGKTMSNINNNLELEDAMFVIPEDNYYGFDNNINNNINNKIIDNNFEENFENNNKSIKQRKRSTKKKTKRELLKEQEYRDIFIDSDQKRETNYYPVYDYDIEDDPFQNSFNGLPSHFNNMAIKNYNRPYDRDLDGITGFEMENHPGKYNMSNITKKYITEVRKDKIIN